jgi:hypothetical protein
MKSVARIEFGDFQTPLALAREVCLLLKVQGVRADVIIEPTCGLGTFLEAAAECYPEAELRGFDISQEHVQAATERLNGAGTRPRATIRQQDFFAHDWDLELGRARGTVLVLGNLPWVTNQTVASLNGSNVPAKENFQGFRGIAARTGKSDFDISEWMLIRLLNALRGRPASISMLCKTATARKWARYLSSHKSRFTARKSSIYRERTAFALFGIGDYTFAPWKVAVSGLHHDPRFVLVPPCRNKPVLFDDTCYFLPFVEEEEAGLVAEILNSWPSRALLEALIFDDAKRPITAELLQRLDFSAIAKEAGMASRWRAIQRVDYARQTEAPQMELVMETPVQARPGRRWKQVQVRVMTSRGRRPGRDAPTIWRGLRH